MNSPRRVCCALGVLLGVASSTSVGRADDSAAAQALFDQGKKAMAAHDFSEACPKFEESFHLDPAMGTLLNLADCYERAGRLATAWSKFLELASKAHAAGQTERARIGRQRAAALAPRLSNLVIQAPAAGRTPGLEVRRDGTVVGQAEWGSPIPTDPGPHTIAASAPGKQPWSTSIDVGAQAVTATVVVPELEAVPPEPSAAEPAPSGPQALPSTPPPVEDRSHGLGTQKILALVSAGIGAAGVGVGTYFGLVSIQKHNIVSKDCGPPTACDNPDGVQASQDARNAGNISTVAFVVGGAGLAGALALWFTAPSAEGSSVGLGVGPGAIQVKGTW
jgi:hypothetical protein